MLRFINSVSCPTMIILTLYLIVVQCLSQLSQVDAKYEEGEVTTNEQWTFVSRFCFLSDDGEFEYSIMYDKDFGALSLLLYYDSDHQWPAVYKSGKSCREKEAVLDIRLNQIIKLVPNNIASGCVEVKSNRSKILTCHHKSRFRSARERWWFLALSNCNTTKGLKFRYKFLMTNGLAGDYWHEHFSADEFYILPVLMGFFFIYTLLVIAVILCASELKSRQLLHSTYKLFALSVYLQEMGILTQGLAYVRYSVDGIGSPVIKTLGRMVEASSEGSFLLLLLLMAKGYTITRGRLRVSSAIKITIFMCIYTVTYITLFIYEQMFFDPGEVLYIYESPAGYGLIVLRIIAWWMFIYFTVFTLKHYPEKTTFYYPFNLVGTLWFVAGPTFILAANTMVDKWVRESVVCFVLHLIALVGHVLFLLLTVPSRANKNFPYHVRTTQIGIMEITDGVAGNNSLDAFGHHPYAPGGPPSPWPRVPVGLFTIAQSNCSVSTNGNSMLVRRQSMAVRRVYTPESLVLRHEEILPNANFMACMIRTELQANTRSGDIAVPLRAITEERRESGATESGDISEERDSQQRRPSDPLAGEGTSGNILKSERNPFIVTTTNQPVPASTVSKATDENMTNENSTFKKAALEETTLHLNGDIASSEESLRENEEPAEDSSSTDKHQTSKSNNQSKIKSDSDRDLDDSYDTNLEESFAINIDRTKFQRQHEEGYSIASFPRDEDLRSSIRKLPPLNLTEESKNKNSDENDKSNGVLPKPAYTRAESRVHFQL